MLRSNEGINRVCYIIVIKLDNFCFEYSRLRTGGRRIVDDFILNSICVAGRSKHLVHEKYRQTFKRSIRRIFAARETFIFISFLSNLKSHLISLSQPFNFNDQIHLFYWNRKNIVHKFHPDQNCYSDFVQEYFFPSIIGHALYKNIFIETVSSFFKNRTRQMILPRLRS